MLDFTSSLYLGLRHPGPATGAWSTLTTGKPAALYEPPLAGTVGMRAAALQGCEAGLVSASTLHLFLDVLGFLSRSPALVLADETLYPIGRMGVERAGARGAEVRWFRHGDPASAAHELRPSAVGRAIVLVTDAVGTDGTPVQLDRYRQFLAPLRGTIVVDNTQALGIYGRAPGRANPYGSGGGGILPFRDIGNTQGIVLIASLAKAFGAPVAVLATDRSFIASFRAASETREHSSPPSSAALAAAKAALDTNAVCGNRLRRRLRANVVRLQRGLRLLGLRVSRGQFPLQRIGPFHPRVATRVRADLLRRGVRTLLLGSRGGSAPVLGIVLRADHSAGNVDTLLRALGSALRGCSARAPSLPRVASQVFLGA